MIRCVFCGRFVRKPEKLEEIYQCKCGAYYLACTLAREPFMVKNLGRKFKRRMELWRTGFYNDKFQYQKEPVPLKGGGLDKEKTLVVPFIRAY